MVIANIFHTSFECLLVVLVEALLGVVPYLLGTHVIEEFLLFIVDYDVAITADLNQLWGFSVLI